MFRPIRRRGRRLIDVVGVPHLTIAAVALLAFVITIGLSPGDSRGQAEIVDGRYVLNSHGVLTPIDKATYRYQMLIDRQAILSIIGVFGVIAAVECTARIRLTADDGGDIDNSPRAPSRLLRP